MRIKVHGKEIHLGYFNTAEEAAHAYDRAAEKGRMLADNLGHISHTWVYDVQKIAT